MSNPSLFCRVSNSPSRYLQPWGRSAFYCSGNANATAVVGCSMNRRKAASLLLSLAALALASCSGLPKSSGGGSGGNSAVSFSLVADTLPANPSILAFQVSINGIQIKPTTGSALTLTPVPPVIDLMRLQSDTAFLGTLSKVPAGTYTVQVSLSNPIITFLNDTGSTLTAGSKTCASGSVCTAALTSAGNPTIASFTLTVTAATNQGVRLDFNLNSAISLAGGTLSVTFSPASPTPGVLSAFTLPRQNANLGSHQLELIEDFTGVVSLNSNNVTVTSPTRGALTFLSGSTSIFDASPDGTMCQTPASFSCVVEGQVGSVDAFLNVDGTLSLKEYEPLTSTEEDLVEGTVYAITPVSGNQFGIVVTDRIQRAAGSLIGGLNVGDLLTVNIPSANPFFVDTKGLPVSSFAPGTFANFSGQTNTSAIHQGQNVLIHVTAFTAASGTTIASATADTVTLRWSRVASSVRAASSPTFTIVGLPSYFGFAPSSFFGVETFTGTAGDVTNFDGIADANSLTPSVPPVGLRALFLENTTNSANPVFFAAKVRQH